MEETADSLCIKATGPGVEVTVLVNEDMVGKGSTMTALDCCFKAVLDKYGSECGKLKYIMK